MFPCNLITVPTRKRPGMHRDGRYGPCRSLSPPFVSKMIIGDGREDVRLDQSMLDEDCFVNHASSVDAADKW